MRTPLPVPLGKASGFGPPTAPPMPSHRRTVAVAAGFIAVGAVACLLAVWLIGMLGK